MSATLRWGDLPIIRDTESGIAAIEREQMTKPRPLEVEGPLLYQPSTDHILSKNSLYDSKDDFGLDATTQHTLQLLQYSHQLTSLIEDAHHQVEQLKSGEISSLNCAVAPPLPTWQPPKKKHPTLKPFAFIPDNEGSLFARGIRETSSSSAVSLDETTCKLLLRRSVAAICAHAGFDSCSQSVLDTLTDVCQEYYHQLLRLLRCAVDAEAYHGGSGFPDAITRVFYEMGIGSLSSVYDFYQSRVVDYHARLLQKCIDMRDEYEQLRKPRTATSAEELSASKNKDDSSSVIHFPSTDEGDETGDMEQVDQLEGLGLDMSISQESSTTLEEEGTTGKWKTEAAGNAKHDQSASEDRLSSSESCLSSGQVDAFHVSSSHLSSDSKRTSAGVISPPAAAFLLKPPLKKFKK